MTPEQAARLDRHAETLARVQTQMARQMARLARHPAAPRPQASLDNDTTRPEPISEEAKMVKMECQVCFAQVSNHVVLPCGQ